jgi:hypothetical protein
LHHNKLEINKLGLNLDLNLDVNVEHQQIDQEMSDDTKKKPEGLGDTIEQITRATRIKNVVDAYTRATGKPCGCAKRQAALNKMFPYGKK